MHTKNYEVKTNKAGTTTGHKLKVKCPFCNKLTEDTFGCFNMCKSCRDWEIIQENIPVPFFTSQVTV